jgi:hypothetical protein
MIVLVRWKGNFIGWLKKWTCWVNAWAQKNCLSHKLSQSLTRNQLNHALFSLCLIDSPWIDIIGGHWGNIKNECDVISLDSTCPMKSIKAFYTSWHSLVKMWKNNHWQGRTRWKALKTFNGWPKPLLQKRKARWLNLGLNQWPQLN